MFNRPFCLKGVDRLLPPGDYRVVTALTRFDAAEISDAARQLPAHGAEG